MRFIFYYAIWSIFSAPILHAAVIPERIAVIANKNDAESLEIADYYQQKRKIPDENIIRIAFPVTGSMGSHLFNILRKQIYLQTPDHVQFYVLAWSKPYKVACMSITSAMTFGFDRQYCAYDCSPTESSIYFNSDSSSPFDDFKIRPTMMLAGSNIQRTKVVIDNGVQSDGTFPKGTAYLVSTTDSARNVRSYVYENVKTALFRRIAIDIVETDALHAKADVLFYFTGRANVNNLETNRYLPGAIADHLTSSGGVLFGDQQMSILNWLDAGVTASYGTVTEPCAFPQKFPHPGIVIDRYTRGESLIEAYWKSVAWPGQGLFVGEPMAAPFYEKRN
ncbi:TIGR03790 family protein [Nitrosomonas sp. Nm51]|uniref:TIGR03790 family protein n=1 Tax=Nitrosomonas sp. Nm51 TaxID=133720 RepID=UPI0008AD22A4|nr:TIGR03790 family protein [Nitrosomonas sp. Nm51]SEQ74913.1 TIGR03790 family protein [Nitrosomonas sp. Nm51]